MTTLAQTPVRYIKVTECAVHMRKALGAWFPGVTFSVRKKNSSIAVEWTDGPTEAEVRKVCKPFTSASFDGMQDLQTNRDGLLEGEKVRFGADYLFPNRRYTFQFTQKATDLVCAYYNVAQPTHFVIYDGRPEHAEWDRNLDIPKIHGHKSLLDLCRDARCYLRGDMTIVAEDNNTPGWLQYAVGAKRDEQAQPAPATTSDADTDLDEQVWALQHPDDLTDAKQAVPASQIDPQAARNAKVVETLLQADLNALSPIEGLTLLYTLKRITGAS